MVRVELFKDVDQPNFNGVPTTLFINLMRSGLKHSEFTSGKFLKPHNATYIPPTRKDHGHFLFATEKDYAAFFIL